MIIIGYQGIGKTTLAKTNPQYIDLESTNTWYKENGEKKRWDNWADIYTNFAYDLSQNYGHDVFVSSHQVVRESLKRFPNCQEIVLIVVPHVDIRDQWIQRLEERYRQSQLDKDYRALMNAKDRYEANILELCNSGFRCVNLMNMNYDLNSIVQLNRTYVGYHG